MPHPEHQRSTRFGQPFHRHSDRPRRNRLSPRQIAVTALAITGLGGAAVGLGVLTERLYHIDPRPTTPWSDGSGCVPQDTHVVIGPDQYREVYNHADQLAIVDTELGAVIINDDELSRDKRLDTVVVEAEFIDEECRPPFTVTVTVLKLNPKYYDIHLVSEERE